jgi:hypothetical protein
MGADLSQKAQASKGTLSPSGRYERKSGIAFYLPVNLDRKRRRRKLLTSRKQARPCPFLEHGHEEKNAEEYGKSYLTEFKSEERQKTTDHLRLAGLFRLYALHQM